MVQWMREEINKSPPIEFKTLKKYRGYLVYISRMYPSIT
jgi:hypothetical protein